MLFNSHIFLLAFLPIALTGYFLIGRLKRLDLAKLWLLAASFAFYAWWNPPYLLLLIGTLVFNFHLAGALMRRRAKPAARVLLIAGVACNLLLLGYFKYTYFFLRTLSDLSGWTFDAGTILLPLAISFFTFQQIAYLVDAARGEVRDHNFLDYCLFVGFFPQLVAGPILHHKEMMPQFKNPGVLRLQHDRFAEGMTFLVLGLGKKVLIADPLSALADPLFDAPAGNMPLLLESWIGVLAFTLGIYFDFSGYSDMAVGLARMFNIRLPYNFNSPYRAASIIEFWRRWHITLSRFLRDYLYIPLGGNRKGPAARYANVMITMLLGGLWHGANWTFVVWGGLHGLYLVTNHLWNAAQERARAAGRAPLRLGRGFSWLLTASAVLLAWVFFRADSMQTAGHVFAGLLGLNGLSAALPDTIGAEELMPLAAGLFIALALPNSQQIVDGPALSPDGRRGVSLIWKPNAAWAIVLALIFASGLTRLSEVSEFIYFQF